MNSSQIGTERSGTRYVETVIIGAGQAGLSTGYHLQRRHREFMIIEGNDRVGDGWRRQWDTLRLYTPAKYDGLPGMPFPGSPWTVPAQGRGRRLPRGVRESVRASGPTWESGSKRVEPSGDGYVVRTDDGGRIEASNVVIATGTFGRTPSIPDFAADLDPGDPAVALQRVPPTRIELQDGPVLVVGASHSGTDVAYEVARIASDGPLRPGPRADPDPPREQARWRGSSFPVMIFMARHVITRRTPIGRREMDEIRFHGGPMIRVKREDLEQRGRGTPAVPRRRRPRRRTGPR